jgi:hypothetical protein
MRLLLFSMAVCLLATSCASLSHKNTYYKYTLESDFYYGNVESVTVMTVMPGRDGSPVPVRTKTISFDHRGFPEKVEWFGRGSGAVREEVAYEETYRYDDKGFLAEVASERIEGSFLQDNTIYAIRLNRSSFNSRYYKNNGRNIRTEHAIAYERSLFLHRTFKWRRNLPRSEFRAKHSAHPEIRYKYRYDRQGNAETVITRISSYEKKHKAISKYLYDGYDNPVSVVHNSKYGTSKRTSESRYEYEYDKHGNWISRRKFAGANPEPVETILQMIIYRE